MDRWDCIVWIIDLWNKLNLFILKSYHDGLHDFGKLLIIIQTNGHRIVMKLVVCITVTLFEEQKSQRFHMWKIAFKQLSLTDEMHFFKMTVFRNHFSNVKQNYVKMCFSIKGVLSLKTSLCANSSFHCQITQNCWNVLLTHCTETEINMQNESLKQIKTRTCFTLHWFCKHKMFSTSRFQLVNTASPEYNQQMFSSWNK